MKFAFSLLLCFSPLMLRAQKMPDYGTSQVHINDTDKTIRAGIQAVSSSPKTSPELTYYWLSGGTIHQVQGGYSGQLLDGSYQEYFLNKSLKTQGSFNQGLKDGVWKDWTETGKLLSQITWDKGWKTGPFSIYNPDGKVSSTGTYDHNLLSGQLTTGQGTDSVKTVRYKKGKIVPVKQHNFLKRLNIFQKGTKKQTSPAKP